MRTTRIGTFTVNRRFFERLDVDEGTNLFHRMVVLRAETEWNTGNTRYFAIHPQFDRTSLGDLTPEYEAVFDAGEVYPRWVRKQNGAA
jgi:hypothetical protein